MGRRATRRPTPRSLDRPQGARTLIPLALLAALIVLGVGVPLALSTWRLRAVWRVLAPRYPPTDRQAPLKSADRLPKTYCAVHVAERTVASPGFTVEATAGGFALVPGLWHRTLPVLWFPWAAIAECELMTRTIGRLVAHCVRLRLAEGEAWMQVDSPAGERLYRYWHAADANGRRKHRAT